MTHKSDNFSKKSDNKISEYSNSFAENYPELMKEWLWEKNDELGVNPYKITKGYEKIKPYWKCHKCGNIWNTTVNHRVNNRGCPECAKKTRTEKIIQTVIQRRGSFGENYPELLNEWNYELNVVSPYEITRNYENKVYWKCSKCSNIWETTTGTRIRGRGCPICSKKVGANKRRKTELSRNGSFANNCSDLMKEWAWEENNQLGVDPYNIPVHYKKKVYWKCQKCNHVYQSYTFTRKDGTGCPKCCASKQFSLPEKLLAYYIKQWFNDTIENYRPDFMKPKEIDIYIPSINIGIEYDGEKYHKNVKADISKIEQCKEHGIKLIRIREPLCTIIKHENVYHMKKRWDFEGVLKFLSNILNCDFDKININVEADIMKVNALISTYEMENSLALKFPKLLTEWDDNANEGLSPYMVNCTSEIKVNWICHHGHHFSMPIKKRTTRNQGCPYCSGRYAIKGENDLATLRPDLIKYWDYQKNKGLLPEQVKLKSENVVNWKCEKCGLEWQLSIGKMTQRKYYCKQCHNPIQK